MSNHQELITTLEDINKKFDTFIVKQRLSNIIISLLFVFVILLSAWIVYSISTFDSRVLAVIQNINFELYE